MQKHRLFIYDFETNGLWMIGNRPIQVAIKVIEYDKSVINYNSYITCDRPLSVTIEQMTGITDQILAESGRPIKDVFKEISDLLHQPNTLVIGHNILRFDNLFLNHFMKLFGHPTIEKSQCFDTAGEMKAELIKLEHDVSMSRGEFHSKALGNRAKGVRYRLEDACEHYGIETKKTFHNAINDIEYTYQVFLKQSLKMAIDLGTKYDFYCK